MERFRLNLVISPRSDPTLHAALQDLPVHIRAARLKELALAGLLSGAGGSARIAAPAMATEPKTPQITAGEASAGAAPAAGKPATKPSLDIDGQLNGLDDIGLAL